jgi:hypothetical protein
MYAFISDNQGPPVPEQVHTGGKQMRGPGGSLEPPGPLPTHLHTVYMEYSECLPTLLNPPAERTCFSQVHTWLDCIASANGGAGLFPGSTPQLLGSTYDAFVAALLAHPTAAASLAWAVQSVLHHPVYFLRESLSKIHRVARGNDFTAHG